MSNDIRNVDVVRAARDAVRKHGKTRNPEATHNETRVQEAAGGALGDFKVTLEVPSNMYPQTLRIYFVNDEVLFALLHRGWETKDAAIDTLPLEREWFDSFLAVAPIPERRNPTPYRTPTPKL